MHHHTSSYQFNLLYLRQLSSRHDKFSTRILPRHRLKNLCVPYININIPFIFSRSFILKRRVIMNQTFFDPFLRKVSRIPSSPIDSSALKSAYRFIIHSCERNFFLFQNHRHLVYILHTSIYVIRN